MINIKGVFGGGSGGRFTLAYGGLLAIMGLLQCLFGNFSEPASSCKEDHVLFRPPATNRARRAFPVLGGVLGFHIDLHHAVGFHGRKVRV